MSAAVDNHVGNLCGAVDDTQSRAAADVDKALTPQAFCMTTHRPAGAAS